MAAHLQESYANLEQKVEERTQELSDALKRLQALSEIGQAVNSSLDLQQVLSMTVAYAVQLSGTDAGAIYEFDETTQEFQLRSTYQMDEELIEALRKIRMRLGETLLGWAALNREAAQVPDILDNPSSPIREVMGRAGFRALLAVPLLHKDRIIGALVVWRRAPGSFPRETAISSRVLQPSRSWRSRTHASSANLRKRSTSSRLLVSTSPNSWQT